MSENTMSNVHIRQMTHDDWSAVNTIYQQGMDTNMATFQTECPSFEEWDKSHLDSCRIVAEMDCHVIGWAALSPVSSRCVYAGVAEVSVYVDSSGHGKGIGTALLDQLCNEAEKNGLWTLQSGIMQNNIPSIRLHEKCGFRMVGYRERIGKDRNGIWRNTVLMEKRNSIE